MAWDTAATRRKILDAALAEFAEHGPAGTTVDRIARRSGVNKERVYNYFGNKYALFKKVLAVESERIAGEVAFDPAAADPIGDYAGRIFDYHQVHPELARLLLWEGLTVPGEVPEEEARRAHYAAKVDVFARAQEAGVLRDDLEPGMLVYAIMALANWWSASPHVARMVTGTEPDDAARRRAAVVAAARRLAAPGV
ncbi:TetR/AcrR family transcriptional regulator [Myceligenerans pegani]|uniref:TetR family transcriptional regulator n=1 Tax=Myceligenerans pegani TaxID=2776917 RepID=A0ABR9N4Y4_9MICO|nr:TetR family transcriptional regulator [Myceligenerans sp. TRM 65318]MBE1878241.1 TetR family transcriptional regulator [Myceligenerans sp. TRM 65318]MBE3020512.1 TetR family transcriptional regulator [Myceligenerans sp. TRM 65318]